MRQLRISRQITNRDSESLNIYLHEISKVHLISADEEISLARRIKNGDPKSLQILINANLRFVVSVAKQYQNQGLSLQDLINEGNLGLIKAAGRYDETKGFKFISYAVWWIRQSIQEAIAEQSRIVRLPLNKIGSMSKVIQTYVKLEQVYQREPLPEEIAEQLKFKVDVVSDSMLSASFHISLDAPICENDENESTFYELLTVGDQLNPDFPLVNDSLKTEISRVLDTLEKREALILRYFFGLIGEHPHSVFEISHRLGITSERVRQIKDRAIHKLKSQKKNSLLKSYLG